MAQTREFHVSRIVHCWIILLADSTRLVLILKVLCPILHAKVDVPPHIQFHSARTRNCIRFSNIAWFLAGSLSSHTVCRGPRLEGIYPRAIVALADLPSVFVSRKPRCFPSSADCRRILTHHVFTVTYRRPHLHHCPSRTWPTRRPCRPDQRCGPDPTDRRGNSVDETCCFPSLLAR